MVPYLIIPSAAHRWATLAATPGLGGILCIDTWATCEPSPGVYDFSSLQQQIAMVPPGLAVMLAVGAGGSAPTVPGVPTVTLHDGAVYQIPWHPAYIGANLAMWQALRAAIAVHVWGIKSALYNPEPNNSFQTLGLSLPGRGETDGSIWRAVGYETDARAAWVGYQEALAAMWPDAVLSIPLDQPGQGGSNVIDSLGYMTAAARAVPGRIEVVDVSFTADRERPIFADCVAAGCSLAVQFEAEVGEADLSGAVAHALAMGVERCEFHGTNLQFPDVVTQAAGT